MHAVYQHVSKMDTPTPSAANAKLTDKKVLVCLGERKREVVFADDGEDMKPLLDAIRDVFSDVLGDNSNELILQVKHEEWSGKFVDLTGRVPDRSGLKAVLVAPSHDQPGPSESTPGPSHVMEVSFMHL